MLAVDVIFLPGELASRSLDGQVAVIFDVLRTTTTMAAALAAGVKEICFFPGIEQAMNQARLIGREKVILCGEQKCLKPDGFDLGNSPGGFDYTRHAGATVFMATTNGTRAILAAADASAAAILPGALVNAAAVADLAVKIARRGVQNPEQVDGRQGGDLPRGARSAGRLPMNPGRDKLAHSAGAQSTGPESMGPESAAAHPAAVHSMAMPSAGGRSTGPESARTESTGAQSAGAHQPQAARFGLPSAEPALGITLVCAGTDGRLAMEDVLGAGAVANHLCLRHGAVPASDAARVAMQYFAQKRDGLLEALIEAQGGQNVIRAGLREDVAFAARLNVIDVAGEVDIAGLRLRLG